MSRPSPTEIRTMMRDRATADIARFGWSMIGVFPTDDNDSIQTYFCYTVGLWQTYGQAELVTLMLRPEVANAVVHGLVDDHLKQGERYVHGQTADDLIRDFSVHFRTVPVASERYTLSAARAYYGHDEFDVLQMVLPDKAGKFPWDAGVDPAMRTIQDDILRGQGQETSG